MGVHALDTARFLLGDPQPLSVYARIGTYYTKQDVDDTGILLVNWDNGAVSYIEAGWWQPHSDGPNAATQLYGDKAFGQLFPTYIQEHETREDPGFIYPRKNHIHKVFIIIRWHILYIAYAITLIPVRVA
jgi:predicted dehydrogenase